MDLNHFVFLFIMKLIQSIMYINVHICVCELQKNLNTVVESYVELTHDVG